MTGRVAQEGNDGLNSVDPLTSIKSLMQAGRFAEAEASALKVLDAESNRSRAGEAAYALAVARRYQGDLQGALQALDQALSSSPEHGRAFQERGHALLSLNQAEEATRAFEKAVEFNPGLLASWKALANLHDRVGDNERAGFARAQAEYLSELPRELAGVIDLVHEGRLYQAERVCRNFLRAHKHHVEALRLLADIATRLRIYDDAEFLLESCVALAPDNLRVRSDYLKILNRKCKFEQAYQQAQTLLEAQPDNPVFQLALANALTGLGRFREGIDKYRSCLNRNVNQAGANVLLGHALKAIGDYPGAIHAYGTACRLKPGYGDAYWSLANTKTYRFEEAEIAQIRSLESDQALSLDDRVHLCFAAGKALEDQGDFESSFDYYRRGNALKYDRSGYDPDKTSAMVDDQIDTCTADMFEQRGQSGCGRPDPIFIVGLPRAGSTLLEQILASHSKVDGTMELHNILGFAQRLRGRALEAASKYPDILLDIDESYFERFGEKFLEDTQVYRKDAPFFIDKMPNNFMHIGLIRLILPNATIIDARRHPMACCFSGFKQLFGEGQDFTYSLDAIGRYYSDYVRLMDHWDAVLPGHVLRVQYEDVVHDLDTQVRRILDFCGLPFEESCIRFHETRRSVRTPSSEQVRQPIYRSGLEQWRNYDPWLQPLRDSFSEDIRKRYPLA